MYTHAWVTFCVAFSASHRLHAMKHYTFAEIYWDEIRRREQQGPFWRVLTGNLSVTAMSENAVQVDADPSQGCLSRRRQTFSGLPTPPGSGLLSSSAPTSLDSSRILHSCPPMSLPAIKILRNGRSPPFCMDLRLFSLPSPPFACAMDMSLLLLPDIPAQDRQPSR